MTNPLIRKLEKFDLLSERERQVLEGAVARFKDVGVDEDMVREGDRPTESTLLLEGFAARYKVLGNGKRQITSIHISGDFIDLQSFLLHPMDHSILALTPCKVAVVPHDALREITERYPHLTRLLWLNTLIDGAIHREWIVCMGRLPALGQMAHLLCELFLRLQAVGQADGNSIRLPLTQPEISDVLGLSTVHVNRVVQELRNEGFITWRGDTLVINDWERLEKIAEFDPAYLNLEFEPR